MLYQQNFPSRAYSISNAQKGILTIRKRLPLIPPRPIQILPRTPRSLRPSPRRLRIRRRSRCTIRPSSRCRRRAIPAAAAAASTSRGRRTTVTRRRSIISVATSGRRASVGAVPAWGWRVVSAWRRSTAGCRSAVGRVGGGAGAGAVGSASRACVGVPGRSL